MARGRITHVAADHMSSRWDRTPASLRASVLDSISHSHILTGTELAGSARRRMFGQTLKARGWSVAQGSPGPMGEVAIAVNDEVWDIVRWRAYQIGPDLGPGDIVVAIVALLKHKVTGRTLLVSTAHLPASVEGPWFARTSRVLAYGRAVRKWRRIVRRWRQGRHPDAILVVADWNLNVRRPWVRGWIRSMWPSLRLPGQIPAQGSHAGGRLIDWPITRGINLVSFRVLPEDKSSDHRKIRIRGRIPRAKRR